MGASLERLLPSIGVVHMTHECTNARMPSTRTNFGEYVDRVTDVYLKLRRMDRERAWKAFRGTCATVVFWVLYCVASSLAFHALESQPYTIVTGSISGTCTGPSRFDALYFTVINVSSVGFGDVTPCTDGGKWIAMANAAVGFGVLAVVTGFVVAGIGALGRTHRRGPPPGSTSAPQGPDSPSSQTAHSTVETSGRPNGDEHLSGSSQSRDEGEADPSIDRGVAQELRDALEDMAATSASLSDARKRLLRCKNIAADPEGIPDIDSAVVKETVEQLQQIEEAFLVAGKATIAVTTGIMRIQLANGLPPSDAPPKPRRRF